MPDAFTRPVELQESFHQVTFRERLLKGKSRKLPAKTRWQVVAKIGGVALLVPEYQEAGKVIGIRARNGNEYVAFQDLFTLQFQLKLNESSNFQRKGMWFGHGSHSS